MKNLKFKVIFKYLRPYKKEFLYGALSLLVVNILSVVIPLEVKRGLLMTGGATIRFVERAGWSNAMKYLLTGIKFDSNEAYRMNLIQEIHETKDLFTRAVELATLICSASPDAIKEVIKNSRIAQNNKKTAISQFDSVQNKLINGKDFKEGIKSFLEKREPYFRK